MTEKIVVKRLAKAEAKPVAPEVAAVVENLAENAADPVAAKPRKKLYVHIGMHKTGTTSIQYALHQHMSELYRCGFFYPSTGRHPMAHVQHASLAESYRDSKVQTGDFKLKAKVDRVSMVAALKNEIETSGKDNVVLSSENFWYLEPDQVDEFARDFSDFDIIPIFFIRNIPDYADSLIGTMLHKNMLKDEYIRLNKEKLWNDQLETSINETILLWEKIAVGRKIVINDYDIISNDDSLAYFLKILGIYDYANIKSDERLNKSHPFVLTYLKYELIQRGINGVDIDSLVLNLEKLPKNDGYSFFDPILRRQVIETHNIFMDELINSDRCFHFYPKNEVINRKTILDKINVGGLSGALYVLGLAVKEALG
jgi:hypothetical protein